MPSTKTLLSIAAVPVAIGAYVLIAGKTGFCPACRIALDSVGITEPTIVQTSFQTQPDQTQPDHEHDHGHDHEHDDHHAHNHDDHDHAAHTPDDFVRTEREGSVEISFAYDISDLTIPEEQVHTLLPRDAIPALTDPITESVNEASAWLSPDDRVIIAQINGETYGAPIRVLNFHEIVNTTVGGEPIALTYCPLCDSATVFSRRVTTDDGELIMEWGVSGALYNSNVLMYDNTHEALWSQLAMRAVSGPLVGTELNILPIRVISFSALSKLAPDARITSRNTGHQRPYMGDAYTDYFSSDRLLVDVAGMGDALPVKTLGLGVLVEGQAIFITAEAIGESYTLDTDAGPIKARFADGGIEVTEAPDGVQTSQTFYYTWSAFNPKTRVVKD